MGNKVKCKAPEPFAFWLPSGCCRVPCVRDTGQVTDLSAAEAAFHSAVWGLVKTSWKEGITPNEKSAPLSVCVTVRALDDMIQDGRVQRARAAMVCNLMAAVVDTFYKNDPIARGLLWYVLQYGRRQECSEGCLERVLAWGVCPHVVSARNGGLVMSGVMAQGLSLPAMQLLLNHGACPWSTWTTFATSGFVLDDLRSYREDRAFFKHKSTTLADMRLQWRRWHARLRRRQWMMMQSVFLLDM